MDRGEEDGAKGGELESGPRKRALTEKGAQFRASLLLRELSATAGNLARLLDRVDAAVADGVSVEEAKTLRDEAMTKNEALAVVYQRILDAEFAVTEVDLRPHDRVVDRYTTSLQDINKFILEQRLEVQSNASSRSGYSRVAARPAASPPRAERMALPPPADSSMDGLVEALARVTSQRLPTPEPEVFDGDRFQFSLWLQSFEAMIEHRVTDKADCLYYLNRYVRGEPREMIRGLIPLRRAEAYWRAKRMLVERYGDPFTTFDAYRQRLHDWPRVAAQDGVGLRKFADFLENCVQASTLLPGLKALDDPRENQQLLKKLPAHISAKWASIVDDKRENLGHAAEAVSGPREDHASAYFYPTFAEFAQFVKKQARIACDPITSINALCDTGSAGVSQGHKRVRTRTSFMTCTVGKATERRAQAATHQVYRQPQDETNARVAYCHMCAESHYTDKCPSLLEATLSNRMSLLKSKGLCFRCLRPGHQSKVCKFKRGCVICGGNHATILHKPTPAQASQTPKQAERNGGAEAAVASVVAHTVGVTNSNPVSHSLVVPVWVQHEQDPAIRLLVYAVLDEQSDATFATDHCLDKLNVPYVKVQMKISTMVGEDTVETRRVRGLRVSSFDGDSTIGLHTTYSRERIPSKREHIPRRETANRWPHLRPIANKLMQYDETIPIGLLIGTDCSRALKPTAVVSGGSDEPYAIQTSLGWGIVGRVSDHRIDGNAKSQSFSCLRTVTTCKEIVNPNVDDRTLERLGFLEKPFSQEDVRFIRLMSKEVCLQDGHYQAPLPLKSTAVNLPDNRVAALNRLTKLKSRLKVNRNFAKDYERYMTEILDKNYAERVPLEEINCANRWYVPHHAINHGDPSRKFRVVFDCSATFRGHSLNQHLLQGPDLTSNLAGLLCRFRDETIAVACDIEKMFYQIEVPPEHRKFIRFLWWENADLNKEPVEFQMKVHLFGATSSPSVANFVLKTAASAGAHAVSSDAVDFVKNDFYVDDGLRSVPTVEEAVRLVKDSKRLCSLAGFRLYKFVSNKSEVLNAVCEEERAESVRELGRGSADAVERMLGTQWEVKTDNLRFSTKVKACRLTRRGLLSGVYSIFDPLGLIYPVVLLGKLMLKELCQQEADWDEPLTDTLKERWIQWCKDLGALDQFSVPRCYKSTAFGAAALKEFHHFSDASSQGIGQCTYLRQVSTGGEVTCALVWAKSRVAPSKVVTVPRLELSAAVLSVNAAQFIQREVRGDAVHFFWTDSTVVLGYIRNESRRFHVFVANRIRQIRDVSDPSQWNYVSTEENPADIASRGVSASRLITLDRWWRGPAFLWDKYIRMSSTTEYSISHNDPEVKCTVTHAVESSAIFSIEHRLRRFSSWRAAKVAFALCLRLQSKYRKSVDVAARTNRGGFKPVTVSEMALAETVIIRLTQVEKYPDLFNRLKKGGNASASEDLRRLDPVIDGQGLIRVGGRIRRSNFSEELKHPVVIPKRSELARLIISQCHSAVKHQGRGITLGEVRGRGYWIVQGSSAVASHIFRCVTCRRLRGGKLQQKMGDLPEDRFACEPAFSCCGVDCFGPWYVKEGRSTRKRYGVLFTCMASRAIHVEVAASLSTDSFINAFRRFVCRRGPVRLLRSDQGTNFVGAFHEINQTKVNDMLREEGCEWQFNVPKASHMGGVWERQIRSVRSVMESILLQHGEQLNDETLHTFLVEAECIVNGRPLCAEDLGAEAPQPLTPNQLLTGKAKVVLPPPAQLQKGDMYSRKLWKRVQYVANEFWHRWRKSYLQSLQVRSKWNLPRRNVSAGDIVIVRDDEAPRNSWQLARVVEAYADDKGLVRKVKLAIGDRHIDGRGKRTKPVSYLERPIHNLVLLLSDID